MSDKAYSIKTPEFMLSLTMRPDGTLIGRAIFTSSEGKDSLYIIRTSALIEENVEDN